MRPENLTERKKLIIETSEQVLNYLLEYRKEHPDFVFYLRQKDFVNSNETRFANGFWFQGSNEYIWISPYNQGDQNNKTRSIGFVIGFDKENRLCFSKEMAFGGNNNNEYRNLYWDIADVWFDGKFEKGEIFYKKFYEDLNLKEALFQFFLEDKPLIDQIIIRHNAEEKFFLSMDKFNELLKNTLSMRDEIKQINTVLVPEIELTGEEGRVVEELRNHKRRERNRKFVSDYKKKYQSITQCPACSIDILDVYKINPIEILELHHILPLSKNITKFNTKLKEEDVVLLCPSCHRVIHKLMSKRNQDKITLEDFKSYLT